MSDYIIMTDSSCDLPAELVSSLGIYVLPLSFTIDDTTYKNYPDERDMKLKAFYDLIRAGKSAMTSAVNTEAFCDAMVPILEDGKDILYLGFSSGLSSTYSAGATAARELMNSGKYPNRKIIAIDTLCASLGQGLMVYLAVQQKNAGKSLDEVAQYVEQNKLHLCHWFTVSDLQYLKRGGRVSATSATIGTMLNIKPVMHMDDNGHLVNVDKVRGRRASLKAIAQKMDDTATDPKNQTIFICHGDCEDEAKQLAEMIKEQCGYKDVIIWYVGPVIGSHTGPGVISLFFLGSHR